MISFPKLYFRYSVGAITQLCQFWENENIWSSKERGKDDLQSCNGKYFTYMEKQFSNVRKTWPIWMFILVTIPVTLHISNEPRKPPCGAVWSTPAIWSNLFLNKKASRVLVQGGADKSLAWSTSRCRRMESNSVVGKRGLFMCRNVSLFLLQRLKGSM